MTNYQQGLNDLTLAFFLGVGFLICCLFLSGLYKLIKLLIVRAKINRNYKGYRSTRSHHLKNK